MSEQRPTQPQGPFGGMGFPDPFAWWKQLYEANEETWAKVGRRPDSATHHRHC